MPKVGMEAERRRSLIDATVDAIHERGYSDVTMAQIAKRAGVSGGLVHHYFGSKDQLLAATMRHLLTELGRAIRESWKRRRPRASVFRQSLPATLQSTSFSPP